MTLKNLNLLLVMFREQYIGTIIIITMMKYAGKVIDQYLSGK